MSAYEDEYGAQSVASLDTTISVSSNTDQQIRRILSAKKQGSRGNNKMNLKRARRQREGDSGVLYEQSIDVYRKTDESMKHIKQLMRGSLDKFINSFTKSAIKTDDEMKIITQAFRSNVIFSDFDDDQITQMGKATQVKKLKKNEKIFKQGDYGDEVYILKNGHVVLEKEDDIDSRSADDSQSEDVMHCYAGDCFGELALIYECPRQMSARVVEDTEAWTLSHDAFRKINADFEESKKNRIIQAIDKVSLLKNLTKEQKHEFVECVEIIRLTNGTPIINRGDEGDTFFMLSKGTASVFGVGEDTALGDNGTSGTSYGPGDYFGERALLESAPRAADIVATSDVELLAVSRENFEEYLGNMTEIMQTNMQLRVLETAEVFQDLGREDRLELLKNFYLEEYKNKDVIIKQGEPGSKFYIVNTGVVDVLSEVGKNDFASINSLKQGQYFGESSLISGAPSNASVVAVGKVSCFSIDREAFEKLMRYKSKELKEGHIKRQRANIAKTKSKAAEMLKDAELEDLKIEAVLGSGCFGLVKLVHYPKLKGSYALKQLEKGAIIKTHQELNIFNEKNILLECDHPFIVKLYKTFKDPKYVYFMMEFVQGGEVFNFLHSEVNNSSFPDEMGRFYIACVLDALGFLHKKSIVYRDLKPENLMIDSQGYIRMVDFGFAKKLVFKTFTVCGTAQYLAPEILIHRGYSKSVDYWTIGILIYEFFTGTTPFRNRSKEKLFDNILHQRKIRFSRQFSDGAKSLCMKLLHKRPRLRLGMQKNGMADVKAQPWFDGLDWDALVNKELPPPWVPKIKGELDHSNFEEYDMGDSPLKGEYDKYSNRHQSLWEDF
mmetsp:Transcript_11074/g.12676  ORF Transcript_11074/g.12676 Transcript_11074/m.12676 type:complete len:835 (-) Transcript_11074:1227-3731(-)